MTNKELTPKAVENTTGSFVLQKAQRFIFPSLL